MIHPQSQPAKTEPSPEARLQAKERVEFIAPQPKRLTWTEELHLYDQNSLYVQRRARGQDRSGSISTIDISTPLTMNDMSESGNTFTKDAQKAMYAATNRSQRLIGKAQPACMAKQHFQEKLTDIPPKKEVAKKKESRSWVCICRLNKGI